jgi:hypothetical protein
MWDDNYSLKLIRYLKKITFGSATDEITEE